MAHGLHYAGTMNAIKKIVAASSLVASVVVLNACSSEVGGSDPSPTVIKVDSGPVSAENATGLWQLHYEWESTPPEAWTTFFGSATSGDLSVAIPSESQKRGMFAAETSWGFAPMISTIADGEVKWSFSMNDRSGRTFTMDFAGSGTGAELSGSTTLSNDKSASATWTAKKVTSVMITPKDLAGDWTLDFQWARRTPGQLLVTCDASGNCKIPGGQDGGPTSDDAGVATFDGNQLTLAFEGSTHVGVATEKGLLWGYMDSTDGNTGVWKASRGKPVVEDEKREGCTANVDCGSCQRCELSTGRCVARLTC